MSQLSPLHALYDAVDGAAVPLPSELSDVYGPLHFLSQPGRAWVIANFVETLDGVVSLGATGRGGGSEISGASREDQMVMGLLRAVADAVVVGAGTHRAVPNHLLTPEGIFPPLASAYQQLRRRLGKLASPLCVVVSARGEVDLGRRMFASGEVQSLVVTTVEGEQRMVGQRAPSPSTRLAATAQSGPIRAQTVLEAIQAARPCEVILVEGGPHLLADFLGEHLVDELFLTLAPQVAGRDGSGERPGLVAGRLFAPEHPLWGRLTEVRMAGSHLFLRYGFSATSR